MQYFHMVFLIIRIIVTERRERFNAATAGGQRAVAQRHESFGCKEWA